MVGVDGVGGHGGTIIGGQNGGTTVGGGFGCAHVSNGCEEGSLFMGVNNAVENTGLPVLNTGAV